MSLKYAVLCIEGKTCLSVRYSGLSVAHWIFILSAKYCLWYCIVSVWGWQRRTLSLLSKKLFPSPPPKAYLSHQVILTTIAIAHTLPIKMAKIGYNQTTHKCTSFLNKINKKVQPFFIRLYNDMYTRYTWYSYIWKSFI